MFEYILSLGIYREPLITFIFHLSPQTYVERSTIRPLITNYHRDLTAESLQNEPTVFIVSSINPETDVAFHWTQLERECY